jgi:hypothetical protein
VICPNCGGDAVDEYTNELGGGSLYCLDGCGFYAEIPDGTKGRRRRTPPPPPPKKKK